MTAMRKILISLVVATLAACSATADPELVARDYGSDIAPISGSITYGGQPKSRLTKAPVGSSFDHEFYNSFGNRVVERYRIQPDRSLKIVSRQIFNLPSGD